MSKGKSFLILLSCLALLVFSQPTRSRKSEFNSVREEKTQRRWEFNSAKEDDACFNDPGCRRNVTSCIVPGCCGFKNCPPQGECSVVMPMCSLPEPEPKPIDVKPTPKPINTKPELDDDACFNDPDCHRNVTSCIVPGCCGFKSCPPEGECHVAMPMCVLPEPEPKPIDVEPTPKPINTKPELDDDACFNDPDCHRNVTSCFLPGCCGFKTCLDNGECYTAMPMCIGPPLELPMTEEEKRICLNNEDCHESITYCPVENCCAEKKCDSADGTCTSSMSDCYKKQYYSLDDDACFWETNCYRNITLCSEENCCSFKSCEKGQCFMAMPLCIGPPIFEEAQLEMTDEAKRICLNNEACNQQITYCPEADCCAYKECSSEGTCTKTMSDCFKQQYDDLNDNQCFWEPNCYRNISSCGDGGGCCGFKQCINGECFIAMPSCIAPPPILEVPETEVIIEASFDQDDVDTIQEGTMTEDEKRICLNNENCHENIAYCPVEDCCAYKQCSADDTCISFMSECYQQRYVDLTDEECFETPDCYRNVTFCRSVNCCTFKQCFDGDCYIVMSRCIVLPLLNFPAAQGTFFAPPVQEDQDSDSSTKKKGSKRVCTRRFVHNKKLKK